ncbi:peptidylprolyl isomerase [Sphingorhabdus sp. 109]|uniref:peptidylprolyl isomerase n=1 Tax=Sphingorhabdus sp. 109 TaxID=2653173 RepID=UPI0012F2A0D3|nr:peptidylprolyl isomerase [Sphingorhabdus sp. 109]VWX60605.1 Peptidylprolyl isomerase [Sphingorhabdus sp. 109]
MRKISAVSSTFALLMATPAIAQDTQTAEYPSPNAIVDAAPPSDWVTIAPNDLLVMDLAPDAEGNPRRVVIQLMPEPFSQGWIRNIRKLAAAHWWDGTSINRVQDNYVVQWGDAGYDNPESGETEQKALPDGLETVPESDYVVETHITIREMPFTHKPDAQKIREYALQHWVPRDTYAPSVRFQKGWPVGRNDTQSWPIHCYGAVGVGRNYSPDTGSGAELFTVIGHAPRHLDRNIAVVGRIVEGMEHLSSLPRGKGQLGFYEDASKRVPIRSIRLGDALAEGASPAFEYLDTNSAIFAKYADARANRRDPFFIVPAGGADICNIPVPVRRVSGE